MGQDELGTPVEQWAPVVTVWAEVEPLRGRELVAASGMQTVADVRIRMRYRDGIEPAMRVVWNGKPHDVAAVIDIEARRAFLELLCVSGVRDGR